MNATLAFSRTVKLDNGVNVRLNRVAQNAIVAAWEADFRERTRYTPWKRVRWSALPKGLPMYFAALMGITNQVAKDQLTALTTSYNAGTAAVIQFYTATRPTYPDTAIGAQTLLGTCTMSAAAWGAPADAAPNATITAAAITDDSSADATGTVTWCRILTQAAGTTISDHNCGTSASDFVFNSVAITTGSTISVTSFVITQPEQ